MALSKEFFIILCFLSFTILNSKAQAQEDGPIILANIGIDNPLLQKGLEPVNGVINLILKKGDAVVKEVKAVSEDIGLQLETAFGKAASIFTRNPTTLKGLIEMLRDSRDILVSIDKIFKDLDRLHIPTAALPYVGEVRLAITLAIPALNIAITTLETLSYFG